MARISIESGLGSTAPSSNRGARSDRLVDMYIYMPTKLTFEKTQPKSHEFGTAFDTTLHRYRRSPTCRDTPSSIRNGRIAHFRAKVICMIG